MSEPLTTEDLLAWMRERDAELRVIRDPTTRSTKIRLAVPVSGDKRWGGEFNLSDKELELGRVGLMTEALKRVMGMFEMQVTPEHNDPLPEVPK